LPNNTEIRDIDCYRQSVCRVLVSLHTCRVVLFDVSGVQSLHTCRVVLFDVSGVHSLHTPLSTQENVQRNSLLPRVYSGKIVCVDLILGFVSFGLSALDPKLGIRTGQNLILLVEQKKLCPSYHGVGSSVHQQKRSSVLYG